jgi:TonB family protein
VQTKWTVLSKSFLFFILIAFEAHTQENLPSLIKKIQTSVVTVAVYDSSGDLISQGSGFFVSREGDLITNYHVVEGASRIEIRTSDGKFYSVKKVVAIQKVSDLVRLSVSIPRSAVKPIVVSRRLPEVGQRVIVIGSPFGLYQTVSDGIVSAVRDVPGFGKIIQLTAPISSGSSGSPVVSMRGEVIGVATLASIEGQNINFAIPGDRVIALGTEHKLEKELGELRAEREKLATERKRLEEERRRAKDERRRAGRERQAKAESSESGRRETKEGPTATQVSKPKKGGIEYIIYRNRMLQLIKERWTWVGKRTDLEVTVRFGILENGEVVKLRVVEASGDPSYDDSVIRAVSRVSPLPPAPDSYRSDFMNVELTFRPNKPPSKTTGEISPHDEQQRAKSELSLYERQEAYEAYLEKIKKDIIRYWKYPEGASQSRDEGKVDLELTVLKDGRLKNVRILLSSGYFFLDREAIRTVKAASPFSPIPERTGLEEIRITLTFNYTINGEQENKETVEIWK